MLSTATSTWWLTGPSSACARTGSGVGDDVGMRILLVATQWPDVSAQVVAATAAQAWQEQAGADEVVARPWAWSGAELPDVLTAVVPGAATTQLAGTVSATELEPGRWVVRLADVLDDTGVGSTLLGDVLADVAARQGAQELIVAFDHPGAADGGAGVLTRLAGHPTAATDSDSELHPVATGASAAWPHQGVASPPVSSAPDTTMGSVMPASATIGSVASASVATGSGGATDWAALWGELSWAQRHGLRLVALTASDEPYFRPGLARGVDVTVAEETQARRLAVAEGLREVLVEPEVQRLVGTPGAGCAGGLGLVWLALGGQLTPGPEHAADVMGLWAGVDDYDMMVVCTPVLDWRSLRHSDVTVAAEAAAQAAVPVVVVAGAVEVGRRELAAVGVHAAYACGEAVLTLGGDLPEPVPVERIAEQMRRVAATWSR